MKKVKEDVNEIQFLPFKKSELGIWHRPSAKCLHELKVQKQVTCIVSILSERECPFDIQKECQKLGMKWLHIPLNGARITFLNQKSTLELIKHKLNDLLALLSNQPEKVLIHCAAGIHRTGTMTYALLRLSGLGKEAALLQLKQLRPVTYEQVGEERIALIDD